MFVSCADIPWDVGNLENYHFSHFFTQATVKRANEFIVMHIREPEFSFNVFLIKYETLAESWTFHELNGLLYIIESMTDINACGT